MKEPRPRHVPRRTCIACRQTEAKRGLVRVVRTPEGRVEVDATGKKSGRGAYVHQARECWEEALRKDRLAHALRGPLPPQDRDALRRYADALEPAAAGA